MSVEGTEAESLDPGGSEARSSPLAKYRFVAELGSGGMAKVFLAVMQGPSGFNKLVVLKIPRPSVSSEPVLLDMFLDEARLAARLNHRNIVQTYEIIHEGDLAAIVMEYLEGHTLDELLSRARKRGRPMPTAMHLQIVSEALSGLHHAHEATDYNGAPLGVVHRDVSPHNIFVTFDGQVKLLDFGVAKAATSASITELGTYKGKVRFMPPEQLRGRPIDRRADLFAMGGVLWEVAVGARMWQGATDVEVTTRLLAEDVPDLRAAKPDIDEAFAAILDKALAVDPKDRYATCTELSADLEAYMARSGMATSTKELAQFVSLLFEDVRAERSRIVQEQLERLSAGASDESALLRQISGWPSGVGSTPRSTLETRGGPGEGSGRSTSAPRSPTSPGVGSEGLAVLAADARPARRSRSIVAVVGTVAVAVVAALGMLLGMKMSTNEGLSPVVSASAVVEIAPSSGPSTPSATGASIDAVPLGAAASVRLRVAATPPSADLYLDDERLPSNPYVRSLPKDGKNHVLRAEAKGYVTRTTVVVADYDQEVAMTLEAVANGGRHVTAPSRPSASTSSTAAPPPQVGVEAPTPRSSALDAEESPRRSRTIDEKL